MEQNNEVKENKNNDEYELLQFDNVFNTVWIVAYQMEDKQEQKEFTSWKDLLKFINKMSYSHLLVLHIEKKRVLSKFA